MLPDSRKYLRVRLVTSEDLWGIHRFEDSSLPLEQGFLTGDFYSWGFDINIGVYWCVLMCIDAKTWYNKCINPPKTWKSMKIRIPQANILGDLQFPYIVFHNFGLWKTDEGRGKAPISRSHHSLPLSSIKLLKIIFKTQNLNKSSHPNTPHTPPPSLPFLFP